MQKKYIVGPKENKPRSDIRITYTPTKKSLVFELSSKVDVLFGKSILSQAEAVCRDLGITSGKFLLEDFGALPFVISARMEAVIKSAHPDITAESLPPMQPYCKVKSTRDRFRRSRLYIPGNQPKLMLNAGIHKPDGIILDLEDAVAPPEKESARFIVRNALRTLDFFAAERMVRINQGEMGITDLEYIIPHNVHLILVPKVECSEQLKAVDEKINRVMKACGRKEPVFIMPIIESAKGVMHALEIAEASPNNVALTIGLEDYTADIGTIRTDEGRESFFARNTIINAARAAGLQAIDTVSVDISDEEALRSSAREAKALGFDGKGCIHPRQIQSIHEEFAPTVDEIEKAKKIVLAFDDARKQGLGVVSLGSKMIDAPVVQKAGQTIELAIASGLVSKKWKEDE
ncbi:MAG TPA: citrate lyase ACP [Candidatus Marinimicrobia bacterium]|nr:citrate lyase ACP [Candidatus Neomarinimicrobiota bacterium]